MSGTAWRIPRGFSLIEVVLAIGIVAFAVLSVFGLLVVGNDTNKRARDEGFAAQIVHNEFARIRSLSVTNFPTTTYVPRYYDSSLADLGTTATPTAVYQLQITIIAPPAPAPADLIFNAEVHFPAKAPPTNQTVLRYTTLMNVPK
jgi:uncharacterized protein (TIGR02598 family)